MSKCVWSDGGNFLAVTVGTEREGERRPGAGHLERGGGLGGCQAVGFVLDNLSGGLCLDNCSGSQQAAHSAAAA